MANTINNNIEVVDSNQDLTIQCSTIQSLFESSSVRKEQAEHDQFSAENEDKLRRLRGTIIDNKTNQVVHAGSFFPYEFTEGEQEKCEEKMSELNHKLEDMDIEYSYEGTIIRIFYYKQWYISTHRKLDSGRSKWGSHQSFKFLFEEGLKESYNLTLKDLFSRLNLRCQYTFMIMADENTRFVCIPNHHPKKVYVVGSLDPTEEEYLKIDRLPKPTLCCTSLVNVFELVKCMKYPFSHQGLLLVHKQGSQYRIVSDEYATLFQVRNNEQSIPYRYLQLKSQNNGNMIVILKQLFPQYIPTFESHEKCIAKLVDIIYHEYNKRKCRSLLPIDLTTTQQIDQKLYLFIKNKLLTEKQNITIDRVLQLLWLEEPSNLNHMIRMVKFSHRKEEQNLILNLQKIELNHTPPNNQKQKGVVAPKKKKVKYTAVPVEFSCRKKLF
jgi:hypothetical protein